MTTFYSCSTLTYAKFLHNSMYKDDLAKNIFYMIQLSHLEKQTYIQDCFKCLKKVIAYASKCKLFVQFFSLFKCWEWVMSERKDLTAKNLLYLDGKFMSKYKL